MTLAGLSNTEVNDFRKEVARRMLLPPWDSFIKSNINVSSAPRRLLGTTRPESVGTEVPIQAREAQSAEWDLCLGRGAVASSHYQSLETLFTKICLSFFPKPLVLSCEQKGFKVKTRQNVSRLVV